MRYRTLSTNHPVTRLRQRRNCRQSTETTGLLSAAQEIALAQLIEAGGSEAADAKRRFVQANIGLAITMATKAPAPPHVSRDDMIQDAMIGLEQAVERFDHRLGYRFSTYAGWWIRQAIQQGLENTAAPIRIPTYRSQELYGALNAANGDSTRLPPKLASTFAVAMMGSLNQPWITDAKGSGGADRALSTLSRIPDPAEAVIAAQDRSAIPNLLSVLSPTNRHSVIRRFGLDGYPPATFNEIADELGISAEAARRRVKRSLKALRPAATHQTSADPQMAHEGALS